MEYQAGNYDVIVIGAGHAGSEAALATARNGTKNLVDNNQFRYGSIHAM